MQIRRLEIEEIEDAILFATRKKPEDFMQILNRCMRDKLFYWGYMEEGQLCGVISVTNEGFITSLYVSPGKSKQMMQKQLVSYAGQVIQRIYEVEQLIVTVPLNSQKGYEEIGFHAVETDQMIEAEGDSVLTMIYPITHSDVTIGNVKKEKNIKVVILIIVIVILVLTIIGSLLWYFLEQKKPKGAAVSGIKVEEKQKDSEDTVTQEAKVSGVGDKDYVPENIEDITKVEPYIGTDVTYGVSTESYEQKEIKEEGNLNFNVQYPVLENLSGEHAEEINNLIKNTALSTVNLMYVNPSEATKALWKDEKEPYLYSHVKYQITYMNNDVISIVYEDHYYMGNTSSEYLDLRSLNINLHTGAIYTLKDVVNINDTFCKSWYYRMCKKAPESWVLPDLDEAECKTILEGADVKGRYWNVFFLHASGVEVGFTYHHQGTKGITRGWQSCKYSYQEMKTYKTDSDFWNYVKNE